MRTVLPLYVLYGNNSGYTGMKEGDRELIACDAFCAVAAYRSMMLRERARPLRESAEEGYLAKLETELQELEIRKFQLDANNAEIDDWNDQLSNCRRQLNAMHHLDYDGESKLQPPTPTLHATLPCTAQLYATQAHTQRNQVVLQRAEDCFTNIH